MKNVFESAGVPVPATSTAEPTWNPDVSQVAVAGLSAEQAAAFRAGERLAVLLLLEGQALAEVGSTAAFDALADGCEQVNFALPYLQRVIAQPDLARGFCAVLSDTLGTDAPLHPLTYVQSRAISLCGGTA